VAPGGTICRAARRQVFTFMNLKSSLSNLHREESGQDLLEYALVLATILAAVVIGADSVANVIANALTTLGGKIQGTVQ
jgi:Flp pilus assembly pilin Flp